MLLEKWTFLTAACWQSGGCIFLTCGLIAREGDVELRVVGQVERAADGLREKTVAIRARLHLEAVGAPIEVDVHHRRRFDAALGRQRFLPIWEVGVAKLAI